MPYRRLSGTSRPGPTTGLLALRTAPEHLICAGLERDDVVANAEQIDGSGRQGAAGPTRVPEVARRGTLVLVAQLPG
jgi:hypothetical protein